MVSGQEAGKVPVALNDLRIAVANASAAGDEQAVRLLNAAIDKRMTEAMARNAAAKAPPAEGFRLPKTSHGMKIRDEAAEARMRRAKADYESAVRAGEIVPIESAMAAPTDMPAEARQGRSLLTSPPTMAQQARRKGISGRMAEDVGAAVQVGRGLMMGPYRAAQEKGHPAERVFETIYEEGVNAAESISYMATEGTWQSPTREELERKKAERRAKGPMEAMVVESIPFFFLPTPKGKPTVARTPKGV